ncbi:MAG: phosphoribosylformylglycinamidine cyclo-ligase [Candidatus Melainabacteria bacterium]|nr:phosphoribosylformylglycinamidine cyclo-ligase [Candidatus Melainabacteria bacterium]
MVPNRDPSGSPMSHSTVASDEPDHHNASSEPYRQAGVDLQKAHAVVGIAKTAAGKTRSDVVLGGIGGFSGGFRIPAGYQAPVLLAACDGVGTKLEIAIRYGQHCTVGIDLVAMSVNDILVQGGEPLVFLDYVATSRLEEAMLADVLAGVAEGCRQANCSLIGGETAEMPGFYPGSHYDLAGFCVGVAEADALLPHQAAMQAGDVLIGLPSSGLHSNGFSLVRKVLFQDHDLSLSLVPEGWRQPLGEVLLTPTRIYVQPVLALLKALPSAIRGMVHITGGGFYDNLPRVLPKTLAAHIHMNQWPVPPVFDLLQHLGQLSPEAMAHTFNLGIGFVLVVDPRQAEAVCNFLKAWPPDSQAPGAGDNAYQPDVPWVPYVIGQLVARAADDEAAPSVQLSWRTSP